MKPCLARIVSAAGLALALAYLAPSARPVLQAAVSAGCAGGAFSIVLPGGTVVGGDKVSTVPAASLSTRFQVRGRYVEFDVVAASFAELNHTFTGPPNPLDMTGGVRTPSSRGKHLIIAGWS